MEVVLARMGISEKPMTVTQFLSEEDATPYNVWKLEFADRELVLKEAKGLELETYQAYFGGSCNYAPEFYASANVDGKDYLLLEYISGETMSQCTREKLLLTLDSLIAMQRTHWESAESAGFSYEKALAGRINRGEYLSNPLLRAAYAQFLQEFEAVPRTLCHDDLLPFNVIVNPHRATFIDWEYGGILPYPASLARLIAHGEALDGALFYMTDADRAFALDYYYENFIRKLNIDRQTYDRTMLLFVFYEYCEWVYLGEKYPDADQIRYQSYLQKATKLAKTILDG